MKHFVVITKMKGECHNDDLTPYQRLMPDDFPVEIQEFKSIALLEEKYPSRQYMDSEAFKEHMKRFPSFPKITEDESPWWKIWK